MTPVSPSVTILMMAEAAPHRQQADHPRAPPCRGLFTRPVFQTEAPFTSSLFPASEGGRNTPKAIPGTWVGF